MNINRKNMLCSVMLSLLLLVALSFASEKNPTMSADQVIQKLKEGNQRFVDNERDYPNQDAKRLQEISKGQNPFATVITCSDSRVPPEHLFDAGLGDLFTIRVAGNVSGIHELGSIEYGVDHLNTPVLLVLGHSHCGAVSAVVNKAEVHGNIPALLSPIVPVAKHVKSKHQHADQVTLIEKTIEANVWNTIENILRNSSSTREHVKAGKCRIVGGIYHLENGKVEWLGNHPAQNEIIKVANEKMTNSGFVHIVFFWLKDNATDETIQQLIDDCKHYLGSIETVRKIQVGQPAGTPRDVVDNSYKVSLIVHFDDKSGHDYYQNADQHLKFIERNKDYWERVQVYDMLPQ